MKYADSYTMLIKENTGTLEIIISCPIMTEMMKNMMLEIIKENEELENLTIENIEYAYNYINKEKEIARLYHFNHLNNGSSERFVLKAPQELLNYIKENLDNAQKNQCKEVNEK